MRPVSSHIGPLISVRARRNQLCHVVLILIVGNHSNTSRAHCEGSTREVNKKKKKKRTLVFAPEIYTHVTLILFLAPQDIERVWREFE